MRVALTRAAALVGTLGGVVTAASRIPLPQLLLLIVGILVALVAFLCWVLIVIWKMEPTDLRIGFIVVKCGDQQNPSPRSRRRSHGIKEPAIDQEEQSAPNRSPKSNKGKGERGQLQNHGKSGGGRQGRNSRSQRDGRSDSEDGRGHRRSPQPMSQTENSNEH
jgi:hypothetical protein